MVFGQHIGFGQAVEQAGFAGVGVAHQRESGHIAGHARFTAGGALLVHALQLLFQRADFLADQASVGFELGFARAFEADAAFLALQMAVTAHQAAAQMAELRQFHLQFTLLRLRPLGKNRQNQAHAVEHAALQRFFQIALLRGRELVVKHHQLDFMLLHRFGQLFCLAGAHK